MTHSLHLDEALELRIEQRTAELRCLVAALESFNRNVSHDLRGPLGAIASLSRLASGALGRGDWAAASRMMDAITAQAEASEQLVTRLLALARMDDEELARRPVALDEVVREALERLRIADPAVADPPVRLCPLPVVDADRDLLRQVYVNLLGNALKFTRHAGSPQIEVGALDGGFETVLYVRDNGIGFDPARAHELFVPFKRLHGARYSGHGVGLSIVRRIVERHGGRAWAEARPGRGATFFFTLGSEAAA